MTEYANKKIKDGINNLVTTNDMYDYYDRDEACDKTTCDTEDEFNYYNYRIGSTGAFNEKGMVSRDNYFDLIKKYKPAIVYRGVFSFRDEFTIKNDIKDPIKMRNLIKKTMKKNIIAMGFEPDNVEWFAFYHTNTGHPHVHFHFYEKNAKKKRHMISESRLAKVKSNVARLMKLNTELYCDRDELKKLIFSQFDDLGLSHSSKEFLLNCENNNKKYFKENKIITDKMKELEKVIPKTGSLKYNSSNIAPFKPKIREIIDLIKDRDDIKELMKEYDVQLDKEIESLVILYGGNKYDKKKKEFKDNRINQIDTKLGNMILSTIKDYRKDIKDFEDSFDKLEKGSQSRKYKSQKLRGISYRNIKQRSSNIISGVGKEISYAIAKSYNDNLRTKHMIEQVRQRAAQEVYAEHNVRI